MIGAERALEIAEKALAVEGADEVEVTLFSESGGLTRFADSIIHQHTERSDARVKVRVVTGRRSAAVGTNRLDEDTIRRAGLRALEMARLSPPDDIFPGLPTDFGASLVPPAQDAKRFDGATADASPAWRAERVAEVVKAAGDRPAAGFFSTSADEVSLANTNGVRRHTAFTIAAFTCMVRSGDGTAHHECAAGRAADIPVVDLAEDLAHWADRGQGAGDVSPGTYPVVLLPLAAGEMVEYLAYMGFGAKDVLNGESFFVDRQGQQVAAPRVSVVDDVAHPMSLGPAFDWEGVWRQRVAILDAGAANQPVYDTRTAAEAGTTTTGHASGSQEYGPYPANLFIAPGEQTTDELASGIERGLLVRRFWYVNVVNQRETILTGMTRDGLFLIEDGVVTKPVHNLRFTQSVLGTLAGCSGVGADLVCLSPGGGSLLAPALRLDAFTFTSATSH
ncbi:MAG TPA: TldD/PmbA family protein [Actinomycetota bacterium]|nr:TldD/PmbA family protein [Actinomycetota bacterium]